MGFSFLQRLKKVLKVAGHRDERGSLGATQPGSFPWTFHVFPLDSDPRHATQISVCLCVLQSREALEAGSKAPRRRAVLPSAMVFLPLRGQLV